MCDPVPETIAFVPGVRLTFADVEELRRALAPGRIEILQDDDLQRQLAAWRIFGRFLLDDVKDETALRDALHRIQADVPRLLAGELISG